MPATLFRTASCCFLFMDCDFAGKPEDFHADSRMGLGIRRSEGVLYRLVQHRSVRTLSVIARQAEIVAMEYVLRVEGPSELHLSGAVMPLCFPCRGVSRASAQSAGGDSCKGAGGDSRSRPNKNRHNATRMTLAICDHIDATAKAVLKGRTTSMRHVSREHRVSLGVVVRCRAA